MRALRDREPLHPALARYREAAGALTGRPDASIEEGIEWIRETVAALGVPGLGELGVQAGMVDDIVAKTGTASSTKGNPIVLTEAELREALDRSMN